MRQLSVGAFFIAGKNMDGEKGTKLVYDYALEKRREFVNLFTKEK